MNISTWLHRLTHRRGRVPMPENALDEIARETHMRLMNVPLDQLVESPQAAMFRMAANVAQEQHERPTDTSLDWSGPDEMLDARMRRVIDAMPARRRAMLLMHAQHGLTFRQVAERFDVSDAIALREIGAAYCALRRVMR